MSFVRSKNIKGHTYYYFVSNHRIEGKVRQKVEKYLGKHKPQGKQSEKNNLEK